MGSRATWWASGLGGVQLGCWWRVRGWGGLGRAVLGTEPVFRAREEAGASSHCPAALLGWRSPWGRGAGWGLGEPVGQPAGACNPLGPHGASHPSGRPALSQVQVQLPRSPSSRSSSQAEEETPAPVPARDCRRPWCAPCACAAPRGTRCGYHRVLPRALPACSEHARAWASSWATAPAGVSQAPCPCRPRGQGLAQGLSLLPLPPPLPWQSLCSGLSPVVPAVALPPPSVLPARRQQTPVLVTLGRLHPALSFGKCQHLAARFSPCAPLWACPAGGPFLPSPGPPLGCCRAQTPRSPSLAQDPRAGAHYCPPPGTGCCWRP